MHLKDMRRHANGLLTGHTDVSDERRFGYRPNDLLPFFAPRKAGVKWYFIEDESPWSEQQIPQS